MTALHLYKADVGCKMRDDADLEGKPQPETFLAVATAAIVKWPEETAETRAEYEGKAAEIQ